MRQTKFLILKQNFGHKFEICINFVLFARWEIQRSKCSAECGDGVQQLSYSCIQTFPQLNHRKVVDDSHCPTSQKSKLYEKCMGPCASATWTYEEFGPVRNEIIILANFIISFNSND